MDKYSINVTPEAIERAAELIENGDATGPLTARSIAMQVAEIFIKDIRRAGTHCLMLADKLPTHHEANGTSEQNSRRPW